MAKFVITQPEIHGGSDVRISGQSKILQYRVQRLATLRIFILRFSFVPGIAPISHSIKAASEKVSLKKQEASLVERLCGSLRL